MKLIVENKCKEYKTERGNDDSIFDERWAWNNNQMANKIDLNICIF